MHQKAQRARLLLVKAQASRDVLGNGLSDLAVVFLAPLPKVMQEDRQMKQIFSADLLIDLLENPWLLAQFLCFRDRQQAVLIHRVLVVLVELHQPSDRREDRDELLQEMGAVHCREGLGHCRPRKDLQKDPAHFSRAKRLIRDRLRVSVDVFEQRRINRESAAAGQIKQPKQQVRTVQHTRAQRGRHCEVFPGDQEIAVHPP